MDIRLVRGRTHPLWAWTAVLVALSVLAYLAALLFGDPTTGNGRASGANANFGADRGAVIPVRPEPFEGAFPLQDRELGRLLRVRGTAESELRGSSLWVRTAGRRWVLMRFEPAPPPGVRYYRGGAVDVVGYLEKISRAEFDAWMDTLGVYLPRPAPGVKFGDLPDSGFIRVDTLFIRDYYISVRPEGARRGAAEEMSSRAAPAATPATPAPAAEPSTPPAAAPAPARRNRPAAAPPPEVVPTPVEAPVQPAEPRDTISIPA